ncbi:MAG: glycoside hydrolase family 88 protein [Tannerellaceae bacterium]|jgi:hypothetical protein|nr:glycoside hydrolase family 88 protein [Tannerellaceae bacterium]
MKFWLSLVLVFCGCIFQADAQQQGIYLDRAEEAFALVWDKYRVNEYGLFSEYYPNSYKPDLNYFQGDVQQAKEVSYLWPMSGVFSSVTVLMEINQNKYASYLDSMVIAVEKYLDKTRTPYGYQAYPSKFEVVDRYYDDNGLVGIDYIDSYNLTKNPLYLQRAKDVMTFIESGWTDDFGGGVSWLEGIRDQKPACSNGKATVLALKLYEATHEQQYLNYGMKSYNWMISTLRDDSLHIIWNSLLTPEGTHSEVQKHPYTYNTGTMIQAAVRLYKITNNSKFLEDAKALAEGSCKFYFDHTKEGIPYVKDMPWFTLVLFRGYQELYEIDKDLRYVNVVIERADWAWQHARDKEGLSYHDWSGREDESKKPKWLLDTSCMAELYARIAIIKNENK